MRKNNLSFLVVGADAIGGITAALMKKMTVNQGFRYQLTGSSLI